MWDRSTSTIQDFVNLRLDFCSFLILIAAGFRGNVTQEAMADGGAPRHRDDSKVNGMYPAHQ